MGDHLSIVDGLLARLDGPMSLRFFLQPLMACFFAFRDGKKDAMERQTPFFWGLFTDPEHRGDMLRSGWKSIGKVFIIAIVLDLAFQYIVFHEFRPVGALLAGVILALVPYVLLRGPANRIIQWKKADR